MEANELIKRMLENRIKELEKQVEDMKEQQKQDKLAQVNLQQQFNQIKANQDKHKKPEIPKHLSGVQRKHLTILRGYRMVFKADPNGACLQNCAAVHIYEDQDEGPKLKKRLNNHVADNWHYYRNKIVLPYVEQVGVGEYAETVVISTENEMIDFLRSDDSIMVYSNTQEMLAIANMFNMNISIFTFRLELLTGTVPVNNFLLTGTRVPVNNSLLTGTP